MLNRFAGEIDYLVIGHITRDLVPESGSWEIGGTAAYSALTAQRLGMRAGILTAINPEQELGPLGVIPIAGTASQASTTFENTAFAGARKQRVTSRAATIHPHTLPEVWRNPDLVHFGPVLDEVDLGLFRLFPDVMVGITPQGWHRQVGADGRVSTTEWPEAIFVLEQVDAAVISLEDIGYDERLARSYAEACRIIAVTAGSSGCRVFIDGFPTELRAERVEEIDPTGAGDIFAAGFFTHLCRHEDPIEAARFGQLLAAASVTRRGMKGVPTEEEIYKAAAGLQKFQTPGF